MATTTQHTTAPASDGATRSGSGLVVAPQARVIGAILTGLDLTQELDAETFGQVHGALLDRGVICLRGQQAMTPDQQLAFAARFGEVSIHPYVPSIEGHPGVMRIYDPNPITQTWHSDTTHAARPPSLTFLLARTIPPVGGDTMWSSAYAAYDGLSEGLAATLAPMRAVHQGTERAADAGLDTQAVTAVHPVVRTHPETGRRALYVNGNYVTAFEGWSPEDSAPLLRHLYAQFERPEYQYRHRWQEGDLVIWDNRCTQHAVVGDTGGAERVLHRVTIAGEVPA